MNKKFLIAEMCQNHNGSWEILERMVANAATAGVTHAKIQAIYASELTYRPQFERKSEESILRPYDAEVARLAPLELSEAQEEAFVGLCNEHNLIPMISVFSHQGVDRAINAGFRSFKIASYDCSSRELIARLLPHAEELVISTGATNWLEIESTAALAREAADTVDIRFLHATTIYPTPLNRVNLLRMLLLNTLGFPTGFSDHTSPLETGLRASVSAAKLGATVIERHFTVLPRDETRDGRVSVDVEQMSEIARSMFESDSSGGGSIAEIPEEVLHFSGLNPSSEEQLNADYYRGRFASWKGDRQIFAWEGWD